MEATKGLAAVGLVVVWMCGVASAQMKGRNWIDKQFETYNVKRISIQVTGTWKGSDAKVDPDKVTTALLDKLEEKGYEVVVPKKGKTGGEPVDAVLKVAYQSTLYDSFGITYVDRTGQETGKTDEVKDYGLKVSARLTLATGKKKLIYEASATSGNLVREDRKTGYVQVRDPATELAQIVEPLPSISKTEAKDGKEPAKEEKGPEGKKDEKDKKDKAP